MVISLDVTRWHHETVAPDQTCLGATVESAAPRVRSEEREGRDIFPDRGTFPFHTFGPVRCLA
jgi:hypothetical protein